MSNRQTITIKATVNAPVEKVWRSWNEPEHIKKWNSASEDWHTTASENDLKAGGRFRSRMEAKDGSFGFDFSGTYDEVKLHETITYTLDDDRKVSIIFMSKDKQTEITVAFEAEETNPIKMQEEGWQAILNNFKKYTEETAL
ncbi:MAG: hypothetical protein K0R05_796 [Anaerocolumna sp.]|jgi:uncharacterized protein YndB with AHSA1/START domain|nr:hypothetical protein [Anaerocolumna sp.]